jgi:diguanylate cyclase (GGDEF)-like protein
MSPGADAHEILATMRTLVLVCDDTGTIVHASGGYGGLFGLDVSAMPGTTVFDHLTPEDADELASYFIENVEAAVDDAPALPMPFRLSLLDNEGVAQPVDIIPSGRQDESGRWWWTASVVPVALSGSVTRSFDLEMKGATRAEVRRMLCEELRVDNESYTSRWMLIGLEDPTSPTVVAARDVDREIAESMGATIALHDWRPWEGVTPGSAIALDTALFPDPLAGLLQRHDWKRAVASPVHLDGNLVSAYLMVGRVPYVYPAESVKENFAARVRTLVDATALLMSRWRDQDQLTIAATRDSMTGLANRDAFFTALNGERRTGALLYIDIDHFKSVNDRFGHEVGDRVLLEVAGRILDTCRRDDVVARFGGDEFVVLLRHASLEIARTIAARVIEAVCAPLGGSGPDVVSVSVGLAMVANGDNPLDAADQAMLCAKRNGRGRLELAHATGASRPACADQ